MTRSDLQARIAVCSFIAAVAFSIAGFIVPPLGDLTDANLYLVAQFLLVTTSIFGVSSLVSNKAWKVTTQTHNETDKLNNNSLLGSPSQSDFEREGD